MATTVNEIWDRRQGSTDREVEYTLYRSFRVITTDGEDAVDVLSDPAIPVQGDAHPNLAGALCTEVTADQDQGVPFAWLVVAKYETRYILPTDRPKVVEWDTLEYQVPVVTDLDGDAVVNSSGEPFDPPPEKSRFDLVLRVTKNVSTFDPATIRTYQGRINSTTFAIAPKDGEGPYTFATRTVLCARIRAGLQEEQGVQFYSRSVELIIRDEGYRRSFVDMGFREMDYLSDPAVARNITDESGQPITRPMLLDGNGLRLDDPTAANAVSLTFDIYPEADLAGLGL